MLETFWWIDVPFRASPKLQGCVVFSSLQWTVSIKIGPRKEQWWVSNRVMSSLTHSEIWPNVWSSPKDKVPGTGKHTQGAEVYWSCHRARGGTQPGQITSLSQGDRQPYIPTDLTPLTICTQRHRASSSEATVLNTAPRNSHSIF